MSVYQWDCLQCNDACIVHYDGGEDGILNYNNLVLLSHEVFLDYITTCICAKGISFSGFARKMNMMYELAYGNDTHKDGFVNKKTWIECFMAWTNLLSPTSQLPSSCLLCGVYPAWLCFDGVSLGMPKKNIMWAAADLIPNVGATVKEPGPRSNLPLIADGPTRESLREFAKGNMLTEEDFLQLLSSLSTHAPVVHTVVNALYESELALTGTRRKIWHYGFAGAWKQTLLVCAASDSLQFFMHPAVVCVVKRFLHSGSMQTSDKQVVGHMCPVLHNLLAALNPTMATHSQLCMPEYGKALLRSLTDICIAANPSIYVDEGRQLKYFQDVVQQQDPLMQTDVHLPQASTLVSNSVSPTQQLASASVVPGQTGTCSSTNNHTGAISMMRRKGWGKEASSGEEAIAEKPYTISGSAWHQWPKLRELPVYSALDKERASVVRDGVHGTEHTLQWTDIESSATVLPSEECKKVESRGFDHKNLTAGIFVGSCVHRICYGFHIMYEPEGRKDIMKVLYERMPEQVLQGLTVLYDFACQAAVYAHRREPELFTSTKWLIDRFHGYSHKCSDFWKMSSYPSVANLCSTASESLNSALQGFNSMCAFMRQDTFMIFVCLIIGIINWLKTKMLQGNVQELLAQAPTTPL